jgi:TP901 family phage tail tape measure protein
VADDLEEIGIKLTLDLDQKGLENSLDDAGDLIIERFAKVGTESGKKMGKGVAKETVKGIKRNKRPFKKAVDDTLGKAVEGSIRQSLNRAFDVAKGVLIANAISNIKNVIVSTFKEGATRAIQFEKGIAEVNSILDSNQKITDDATNAILRFSNQFGTSQQKQVRSFYNIVSAGIKGTESQLAVLNVANKAAIAGLVDIDTAAFALVSSVNAYSGASLTASRASDVLFRGVKEGQLVFRDLASNLGRVAPIGFQLGLSFSEVVGSISAITRQGLPAAEAASALRQLFSTILGPSAQAKTAIDATNKSIQANIDKQVALGKITAGQGIAKASKEIINFSKAGVKAAGGISPFLSNLTTQLKGNSEALNVLFKNIRAFTAVAAATSNVKQFDAILKSVENSTGATDAAFNELSKTFDFKIGRAAAILRSVGTAIFDSMIPASKEALDFFTNNFAPAFLTVFDGILAVLPGLEVGFNGLVGAVKFMFNSILVTALGSLKLLIMGLTEFIGFLGTLSPLLEAKLTGLSGVLATASESISEPLDDALSGVRDSFDNTFDFSISSSATTLKERLDGILLNTDSFTEEMKKKLKKLAGDTKTETKKISKDFEKMNSAIDGAVASGVTKSIKTMATALANGENIVSAFADNFLQTVGEMAIMVGEVFIAIGIGKLQILSGDPSGIIAIGAGLIVLGAILSSFGGGGAPSGAAAGGGGGVAAGGQNVPEEIEPENAQPQTIVNLNIEGSVFDGDNTARRLADLLNAGFEDENITLKQGF